MKKVGIVCCSNGQSQHQKSKIEDLTKILYSKGLTPIFSDYIYQKNGVFSGTAKERATALMNFYKDEEIQEIFDISGGDIANEVLPYLDFEVIAKSQAKFWGYSDLTTIINAIYTKTGKESVLYQVRNLIAFHPENLFDFDYQFVQKEKMHGIVVGGNIRCLLKLAGTPYWPDIEGKILLLESRSGSVPQMVTYLNQLKQMEVFGKISGILLGTFTQMEEEKTIPTIIELVKEYAGEKLPIAKTQEIGHGIDSKAIVIGKEYSLYTDK
jgi:muramoyltetrapeptide carboxypeptidase LdcA involved in peptidoglycan recycling